jgi:histone deacetylase 1/2
MPPSFWAEALSTATFLINIRPTSATSFTTPFETLHGTIPPYDTLRVFGCLCYPNTLATSPNKLAPRSTKCIFLGYPARHRGYRCLDLSTRRIIISRHVTFDEHIFPYASISNTSSSSSPTPDLFDPIPIPYPPAPATNPAPAGHAAPAASQPAPGAHPAPAAQASAPTNTAAPAAPPNPPPPPHRTRATTGRLPGPPKRLNL